MNIGRWGGREINTVIWGREEGEGGCGVDVYRKEWLGSERV